MKHATHSALESILPVLDRIRTLDGVRERKPGIFYRKSSAFIHFHEDPAGIFADIRQDRGWLRLPVNSPAERNRFIQVARKIVSSAARCR